MGRRRSKLVGPPDDVAVSPAYVGEMDSRDWVRLAPLALATMASQALLVVLGPIMVAVGADLGASVGAIGQARSVTAVVAIAVSASIATRVDRLGVSRLVVVGGALAVAGCAAIASAPALAAFLLAHVLVGIAVACLLSAGFAGTAGFAPERRAWAIGCVAGANALAWIVVAPVVGMVAARSSWRTAEAIPAVVALAATRGAGLVASLPRRPLITVASLLMGALFVVELGASGSAAFGVAAFCILGLAAGVRTPASSALGLLQLPDHPGAMIAARTAANELGYLLGALVGGTAIAVAG
jgi:predicted MFS family arabinose efflux permease